MRALSLTQPWPWIILHQGKRIENRTRNIGNYRGPILLHASSKMTHRQWLDAAIFVQRFDRELAARIPAPSHAGDRIIVPPDLPLGAIVGRATIVDQCRPGGSDRSILYERDWVASEKWYMGEHAYLLADVQPMPLIECKGALGFWRVPASVLAQLDAP